MQVVSLVIPVKTLATAKSRLRGAADGGVGEPTAHARLALALAHDTVAAARAARRVGALLVVSSDPVVAAELGATGVEVVAEGPEAGLNPAYRHGAALLRRRAGGGPVAGLQADLPALRPADLDAALDAALSAFAGGVAQAAFVPDADGTGTTFLAAAGAFVPRFGPDSARRHREAGAVPLPGGWPGLRRDVDTSDDLRAAAELGLGPHTRGVLQPCPGG